MLQKLHLCHDLIKKQRKNRISKINSNFILIMFSVILCFVIVNRFTQTQKKLNRQISVKAALNLKHVTLCEDECISFLIITTLLLS